MPDLGPQYEVACNVCEGSKVLASKALAEDIREAHIDEEGCPPERVVVQEVDPDE